MKSKLSIKSLVISVLLVAVLFLAGGLGIGHQSTANASRRVYDLSEWQGRINDRKARKLKNEVSFVILRAQYGRNYQDRQFQNSINQMTKHHVPYGVYSYSLYRNKRQARKEASTLYYRAPKANFYVNDIEENRAKHRINSSTIAWAKQMKRLTTRPIVLYSYANFIKRYLMRSRKYYNAVWLASYSKRRPTPGYKYDMWQYTSKHYSKALRKKIDASILTGKKPLSFWIGNHGKTAVVKPVKQIKPVNGNVQSTHKKNTVNTLRLTHHQLRKYHHEMRKLSKRLRMHKRLTKNERKALKIYKLRHGHAFQL